MVAAEWKVNKQAYVIHRIPVPSPHDLAPYDLLIKIAVASFCHTDMMLLDGDMEPTPSGFSGGHEPTGTVVAIGSAVKDFRPGDRVSSLGWYGLCGKCDECESGIADGIYCREKGFLGGSLPGAFCEYMRVDSRQSAIIPDVMSFQTAAPLTCAGATAFGALKKAVEGLKQGGTVALFGAAGGVGHLGLLIALAMGGFKVIAVEARDSGLEFCRKAGAHATMDARVPFDRFTSEAQELTALKLGFDRCIVFSDHDSALPLAMASTRPHGLVVQVGQPSKDLHFYFKHLVLRDVRLIGTMLGNRSELRELLQFVSDKRIPVAVTPSHGVETLNEVLSVARGGDFLGKLVVVVDAEAEEDDKYHGRK